MDFSLKSVQLSWNGMIKIGCKMTMESNWIDPQPLKFRYPTRITSRCENGERIVEDVDTSSTRPRWSNSDANGLFYHLACHTDDCLWIQQWSFFPLEVYLKLNHSIQRVQWKVSIRRKLDCLPTHAACEILLKSCARWTIPFGENQQKSDLDDKTLIHSLRRIWKKSFFLLEISQSLRFVLKFHSFLSCIIRATITQNSPGFLFINH